MKFIANHPIKLLKAYNFTLITLPSQTVIHIVLAQSTPLKIKIIEPCEVTLCERLCNYQYGAVLRIGEPWMLRDHGQRIGVTMCAHLRARVLVSAHE
eukprot:scaffold303873_cov13-Prasinocladus_malaysianus.AAC.1